MVGKNDTKRKGDYLYHPYNTRSRRSNTPHPSPQFKDTPAAAAAEEAGEPEKKVPLTLYNSIKQAIAARRFWEAKKNNSSWFKLVFTEKLVNQIADSYKKKQLLSLDWKFNPAIASTYESKDDFPLMLMENGKPKKCVDGPYFDSYVCSHSKKPEVDSVPLKDYETESWQEFKKLDEKNFSSIQGDGWGVKFPLSNKHPFVKVIGDFAVNGFNVLFETYVEKANHSRLGSPTFKKCTYSKRDYLYEFEMTILADEDGFRGIYKARLECSVDDCKKTLCSLSLTDVEQGKIRHASKYKSSHAGLWLPDIQRIGMCRRNSMYGLTYGCYDYTDPCEIVG